MNFAYHMPTKVFIGRNCLATNAAVFSKLGKKALIVTGKSSAKISGALEQVQHALKTQSIEWEVFDQVDPNPSIDNILAGAEKAKKAKVEFIIGIGGGSPMDAAKAIALVTMNPWGEDLFRQAYSHRPLPICAVPTTAGTGSEVTQYAIVTDTVNQTKRSIATPDIFPRFAFLDGEFMKNLPAVTTTNTAIDALSHAAEGFLSRRASPLSDQLAKDSLRILGNILPRLDKKLSLEDRDQLLYASMLAGVVIAQTGTTIVHGMGYSLTYFLGIDHGRANGLLFTSFLKFSQREQNQKVNELLSSLSLTSLDDFKSIINRLLGDREKIADDELINFSHKAIKTGNVNNTCPTPTREEILKIFRESFC